MRRLRRTFVLCTNDQFRVVMGGVEPAEPRWWLGRDYLKFGKPGADVSHSWRPATTLVDFTARRAAFTQHLVVSVFLLKVENEWPGRELRTLGAASADEDLDEVAHARGWASAPRRLATLSEAQTWSVLRGRTTMSLVALDDLSRLVRAPLLTLSPLATNFADYSAGDVEVWKTDVGVVTGPFSQRDAHAE